MLDRPPKRLDQHCYWDVVTQTLFALVLVVDRPGGRFQPGVASYFDTHFPGLFTFGILPSRRIPQGEWWLRAFRTSVGPLRPRGEPADSGYYLLEQGFIVGHVRADGARRDPNTAAGINSHLGRLAEARRPAKDPWAEEPAVPEPVVVHEPLERSWELLEVDASATDAEIRAAFRTAMKLNHPDRVAHMSQAIQDFARERTEAIHEAYQAITEWRQRT